MNTQARDLEELKNVLILAMSQLIVRAPNGVMVIQRAFHDVLESFRVMD